MIQSEIKNNLFFSISLIALLVTSCFSIPRWEYIDLKVIVCLFELMLVVKAFEDYGFLGNIAVRIVNICRNDRQLVQALCLVSFLLSMFVTNDVAILTLIPILLLIAQKTDFPVIIPCILITIAANLGSSITPIGNPQNLYIFSFYQLGLSNFFRHSLVLGLVSLLLLLGLSLLIKPKKIQVTLEYLGIIHKKKLMGFVLLSILIIMSVPGILPYWVPLPIVLSTTLFLEKKLLKQVDYRLLLTFICIFLAIGNTSHIPVFKSVLVRLASTPFRTYISSIVLSQGISNVPATVLLSPFATYKSALFYGVNIGGLGTPIASLASVIAFALFQSRYGQNSRTFLSHFLVLNFCCLTVLSLAFAVIFLI